MPDVRALHGTIVRLETQRMTSDRLLSQARRIAVDLEQELAQTHLELVEARAAIVLLTNDLAWYTAGVIDA